MGEHSGRKVDWFKRSFSLLIGVYFKLPHLHMLSKKPPIRVAHLGLWALTKFQRRASMLSPKYKWELP